MDREAAARAIDAFLLALGREAGAEPELVGTGSRVAAAFADELLAGYSVDVDALLSANVFPGASDVVVVRDVPVATTCPHHLMAATGHATVAFAPAGRLVGVGTVARVLDAYARRLALQEQLGERTVAALNAHLSPRWVACRLVLGHACMTVRGERSHGARVETTAVAGTAIDRVEVLAILLDVDVTVVGRVPLADLADGAFVRLDYPPFDVLVALVQGAPVAIEDACNHAGASLSEGPRRGDCVMCPMHGYVFELATGRLIEPRGLCTDQRRFVTRVEGDDVVVTDPGAGITVLGP